MKLVSNLSALTTRVRSGVRDALSPLQIAFDARWSQLSTAQQRIVGLLALVLVALLIWALVLAPLRKANARLEARLPALAAQLATMEQNAIEVQALRTIPAAASSSGSRLASVEAVQEVMGSEGSVALDKNVQFVITASKANYATLIDRLDQVQARFSVRVVSMKFDVTDANGVVNATLVLADGAR